LGKFQKGKNFFDFYLFNFMVGWGFQRKFNKDWIEAGGFWDYGAKFCRREFSVLIIIIMNSFSLNMEHELSIFF
jgi:hypothetical protein